MSPDPSLGRNAAMRVAMATVVALLILYFVDEHYNDARYTRAATAMLSLLMRGAYDCSRDV